MSRREPPAPWGNLWTAIGWMAFALPFALYLVVRLA